jgi:hypothetical protein
MTDPDEEPEDDPDDDPDEDPDEEPEDDPEEEPEDEPDDDPDEDPDEEPEDDPEEEPEDEPDDDPDEDPVPGGLVLSEELPHAPTSKSATKPGAPERSQRETMQPPFGSDLGTKCAFTNLAESMLLPAVDAGNITPPSTDGTRRRNTYV